MKETEQVAVTQRHIEMGSRCSSQLCPIALAVKEALEIEPVCVDHSVIVVGDKDFHAPLEVRQFIALFDSGSIARATFKPFTFTMEAY
jgi:hypothetical protein